MTACTRLSQEYGGVLCVAHEAARARVDSGPRLAGLGHGRGGTPPPCVMSECEREMPLSHEYTVCVYFPSRRAADEAAHRDRNSNFLL